MVTKATQISAYPIISPPFMVSCFPTLHLIPFACATTISFVRVVGTRPAGRSFGEKGFLVNFGAVSSLCGAPTVDLIIGRHFFLFPFFPLAKVCEDDLSFIMQMRDTWQTNGRRSEGRSEGGREGRYGESSLGNCPERTKHGQAGRRPTDRPTDDVDDDQASTCVVMVGFTMTLLANHWALVINSEIHKILTKFPEAWAIRMKAQITISI